MLKVGITGGIGTGKSTVSQMFAAKGIAVYDSDLRAKTIMLDNEQLVGELKNEFGIILSVLILEASMFFKILTLPFIESVILVIPDKYRSSKE